MALVRPIRQADKGQWFKLWCAPQNSYLKFYDALDKVSETDSETTFTRFFDPNEPVFSAVAEVDGEIVGFANMVQHRSTWSVEDALYLNDLYVSETCRGGGVGKKLIEYFYEEADKRGCKKVYWTTASGNITAQKLYNKVGSKFDRIMYVRK